LSNHSLSTLDIVLYLGIEKMIRIS